MWLQSEAFPRELGVGDVLPEIALVNSHGGGSSFRLDVALLEKVCRTGLLVERSEASHYRIFHVDFTETKVADAVRGVGDFFPAVLARRGEMQRISLDVFARLRFAEAAARLRWGENSHRVATTDLLQVRHAGQRELSSNSGARAQH